MLLHLWRVLLRSGPQLEMEDVREQSFWASFRFDKEATARASTRDLPPPRRQCCVGATGLIYNVAKLFSYSWTMGAFMCKLVHYMQNVSAVCSVLTLTAMSLERYYAIVHPMRAKYICTISQAKRIIGALWIASILLAVPMIFVQVQMSVGERVKAFWCVPDDSQPLLWRSHELYMLLLILVVPTGIMALAYSAICWEVWRVVQRRHHMTSGRTSKDGQLERPSSRILGSGRKAQESRRLPGEDNATVKQVIKMLVAVVVLFVVCWGPLLVFNVLRAYDLVPVHAPGAPKHIGTAFHLMAYFNSCINPLVYGFMSRNFRESFRKALCLCWGHNRSRSLSTRHPSLNSHTRTTSMRYQTVSMTLAGATSHHGHRRDDSRQPWTAESTTQMDSKLLA